MAEIQYGTQRLDPKQTPLGQLLTLQAERKSREQDDALRTMRQFKFRDVYIDNDGTYKEWKTDNQGNLIDATISKGIYDNALRENEISNQARVQAGLNPVETTPAPQPEPKKDGFFKRVSDAGRSLISKAKGLKDNPLGNQNNQLANPNLGGANVDITKQPSTGGQVKQSLFDNKIGETSPMPDMNNPTEIAYQKSLQPKKKFTPDPSTERAYRRSLPPPNMSDREIANMGKLGRDTAKREARRKHLDHIIEVKKEQAQNKGEYAMVRDPISKRMMPNSYWTQEFKDANPRMFRDTRHMGKKLTEEQKKNRLQLPTPKGGTADEQLAKFADAEKEKRFIASAKADNKKANDALRRYEESLRPPSPNRDSIVYKGRTQDAPVEQGGVRIPSMAEASIYASPQKKVAMAGGKRGAQKSIVQKNKVDKAKRQVIGKFLDDIKSGAKTGFDAYMRMANRKPSKESEMLRKFGSFK